MREDDDMTTHTTTYQREQGDDVIELEVEFTLSGGHPGVSPSLSDPGEPPEGPEMEIVAVTVKATGETADLTDDEEEAVRDDVYGRLGDFDDGDGYYEDY